MTELKLPKMNCVECGSKHTTIYNLQDCLWVILCFDCGYSTEDSPLYMFWNNVIEKSIKHLNNGNLGE